MTCAYGYSKGVIPTLPEHRKTEAAICMLQWGCKGCHGVQNLACFLPVCAYVHVC